MLRSCSKCGRIHDSKIACPEGQAKRIYNQTKERQLRRLNKWKRKSVEIREQAHNLCEVCADNGVYVYDGIEVHHIVKIRNDETLLLEDDNLICLCSEHHKQADRGELDAEYLKSLALKRINGQGVTI